MALTYLNSQMIEVPAAIADLSARNLQVSNLTASNFQTPTFGNAAQWNDVYTTVTNNSASWEESADITAITTTVASNSGNWNASYGTVNALSGNWNDVYTIVNTLSNNWEETADILPTITNYLSTNNVTVQDITLPAGGSNIFNDAQIFGNVIVHGSLSALSGAQIFQTITTTTSSLSVENYGTGPALYVFQTTSLESVAQIKGANGVDILTINNVDLDQGQDGVKVYFTGSGNTFVVGNSANATALVVTSAGNINTTGQILSGNTPLHNIFLTAETDSQTLSYNESTYNLAISNGNTVNLSSVNTIVAANSAKWEGVYTTVNTLSTNWQSTYETVSSLSAFWEESADILPTVTNYLSTSNVLVNGLTVSGNISATGLISVSSAAVSDTLTTTNLTILSSQLTPTLSTDSGIKGTFKWDTNYLYICIETDTWKRVALSGWES